MTNKTIYPRINYEMTEAGTRRTTNRGRLTWTTKANYIGSKMNVKRMNGD